MRYRLVVQLFPQLRHQTDDQKWEDDLTEDQTPRAQLELEPGDVIQEVRNVTRVAGGDPSRQSLFSCIKRGLNFFELVSSYLERCICICLTVHWCGKVMELLERRIHRRISAGPYRGRAG